MVLSSRIGAIEFAGDVVRLAVVKTGGKRPRILELREARAEYAEPELRQEALVEAVQALLGAVKKKPMAYILCVPTAFAIVRTLAIPFKGARKVAAAVPFELERFLAIPIDDVIVDYLPVLEIEGQTEVLAAGLRRKALQEQIDVLKAAGVDPQGIGVDALGLTGLWRACHPAMKGLHAVLHARETHAVLAVTHNKSLVYFRHLPFTADEFEANPGAVAQEVQNSLRAFHANWRGGGEVLSMTVTGLGLFQENRDPFEREFDIPITYENLLDKLKGEVDLREPAQTPNAWESLAGVALGMAGGGYGMNFGKDEFASENRFAGLVPHFLLTACLMLVLFAGVIQYYRSGRAHLLAEADELNAKIDALSNEVDDLQKQGISVAGDIFADPNLLDILKEISDKLPDSKATIKQLKIEPAMPGERWIVIEGEVKGDDNAFLAAFKELKKSPLFLIPEEKPKQELIPGHSTFQIVARKPEPGKESSTEPQPAASPAETPKTPIPPNAARHSRVSGAHS